MTELPISFLLENGICIIQPIGRLDPDGGPALESFCLDRIQAGDRRLLLDMAEVPFVSSAGLRSILIIVKKLEETHGKLALCQMQPMVEKIFTHSGFSTFLQIKPDRESAIASLLSA